MKRRYSSNKIKHPLDANPFEAFYDGSWWTVKKLGIKDGGITVHFEPPEFDPIDNFPNSNIRLRSRKASLADCICFLRPGLDVCVASTSSSEAHSGKVWSDAKIKSIERTPHENGCTCRFYVNLYVNHHSLVIERSTLNKEIQEVSIDDITILQQLARIPCENEYFRWSSSKDSPSRNEAKLFRCQFLSDVSWFLVTSMLKFSRFDFISVQKKMVYQYFEDGQDLCSLGSNRIGKAINFQIVEGVLRPIVQTFEMEIPEVTPIPQITLDEDNRDDRNTDEFLELRRSKRPKVQPERFVGSEDWVIKRARKEAEIPLPLPWWQQDDFWKEQLSDGEKTDCDSDFELEMTLSQMKIDSSKEQSGVTSERVNHDNVRKMADREPKLEQISRAGRATSSSVSVISQRTTKSPVSRLKFHPSDQIILKNLIGKLSSKCGISGAEHVEMRNMYGSKNLERKFEENTFHNELRSKRSEAFGPRKRRRSFDANYYKRKFYNSREYRRVIKRCMNNINAEIAKHQSDSFSQWQNIHETEPPKRWRDLCFESVVNNDKISEEDQELDSLWKEMELSMNALNFLEESQTAIVEFSKDVTEKSRKGDDSSCQHELKMEEEIGVVCQLCKCVITEIKYVLPQFLQNIGWVKEMHQLSPTTELACANSGNMELDILKTPATQESHLLEDESESVWALIPDLKNKLHVHQKKAFEFIWRNIAGSLLPADMEVPHKRAGGCVISHSPGAGKTLLVISFLVSYLRLFPRKRPLILAPNTTLYAWEKEIKKWDVSIPIYQIHSRRNYNIELQNQTIGESTGDRRLNQDVMHAIDCLEKLRKWHDHPSVLLMSYPSFFSMMREKSKLEYWRYMAGVLRESPGILILDEGHNPRSTNSRLRKSLMEVKTDIRILLSGTLFQNNFEEYFNTLCLARPRFISEVLRELDRDRQIYRNGKKRITSKVKVARKIFVDKIGKRINSKVAKDRRRGLFRLKKLTNRFIDVYEGGVSDRLPGLEAYTLLIKPTAIQENALSKLQMFGMGSRYPLELELLTTLVSIHPWLIKSLDCVDRYFSPEQIEELEKDKFDVTRGPKVRFVINLVHRCIMKREKVLMFCRNIAPIKFFVEIFSRIFSWEEGNEVLILHGDQLLYERKRVIDKFEESAVSQVLLASIGACGEGISLTAASRVVLLDSEWNPSKIKQAVGRAFRPGQERMVYVYQLLSSGTVEETKHNKTEWKDWVSRMIFVGKGVEDSSQMKVENIDDDVLRNIVEEDEGRSFRMIMKDERLSNGPVRGNETDMNSSSTALLLTVELN